MHKIIFLAALLASTCAAAQPSVKLAPVAGHPSITVTISGTAFGDSEAVDIYVDTTDTVLLVTTATGTFTGPVTIPASSSPGKHTITAIGRHSGEAAQASFDTTTPWVKNGFGAASIGLNPYENTLSPSVVPTLGELWSVSVGGGSPIYANGRVYVGGYPNAGMSALNAATGAVLWKTQTSSTFFPSPLLVGANLFVGSGNNTMLSLSASTGALRWSQTVGGFISSGAAASGSNVIVGCEDGKVYAFNQSTGAIAWTYATGNYVYASPAIVDGIVYIGSADDKVYALNAATGNLVWSYTTNYQVTSSPAVANATVFIGSGNTLYALRKGNGAPRWAATAGTNITGSPAVANGIVYVGAFDGNIYAFNAATGAQLWATALDGPSEYANASVADGVVYIGTYVGTAYALNAATGAVLWSTGTGAAIQTGPVIADGQVYISSGDGTITAYAPQAGTNIVPRRHAPRPAELHPDLRLPVTKG